MAKAESPFLIVNPKSYKYDFGLTIKKGDC